MEVEWVRVQLEGGWLAVARVEWDDATPVISELRVVPAPREREDEEWLDQELTRSAERDAARPLTPYGGLTARRLRELSLGAVTRRAQASRGAPDAPTPSRSWSRPGRRGHPDSDYAVVALVYASAVARGDPTPVKRVAEKLGTPQRTAEGMVREARRRGLLAGGLPGRPGGKLTGMALDVLRADAEHNT